MALPVRPGDASVVRVDLRDEERSITSLRDTEQRRHAGVGRARQHVDRVVLERDRILGMGTRINRPGE
jgi:hypothetical protein